MVQARIAIELESGAPVEYDAIIRWLPVGACYTALDWRVEVGGGGIIAHLDTRFLSLLLF